MPPTPHPRIAVAIGIVVDGPYVLICRRPPGVPLPGLWEFPGGKIEPGESPAAAAVRELKEETGLDVVPAQQLPPIAHDYPHAHVTLIPLLCRRVAGHAAALQCAEFRWIPPADLPLYPFPPGNAALLSALLDGALQLPPPPVIFAPPGD